MTIEEFFNRDMTPNWEMLEKIFPKITTCHHSIRWHREGNILNHTKLVTNEVLKRLNNNPKDERYVIMVAAAMLHDVGKLETTYWNEKENDWCCKSHGEAGAKIVRNLFQEEIVERREKIVYMARYHMLLHYTQQQSKSRQERDLKTLYNGLVPFEDMLLLNECDMRGSINDENTEENISKHINELLLLYDEYKSNVNHKLEKKSYKGCDVSPKMYVMIGVPGSGKSTYAKDNLEIDGMHCLPIFSRDKERIKLGLCGKDRKCVGNSKEENYITKVIDEAIKAHLEKKMSFIVDNTSLKKKYREPYTKYAQEYGFSLIFVYIEAPSLEDNFRRRNGTIDKDIIQNMWDKMEFPTKDEYDKLIISKQKTEDDRDKLIEL